MITATDIAKAQDLKSYEVNHILISIGFLEKTSSGYKSLNANLGKTKIFQANKTTYVLWKEDILNNLLFKGALAEYKKDSFEESPQQKKDFKFDRSYFKAEFRTIDGHFVRSKAEALIDNWLYMNNIVHAYEKRVPIQEEVYCDFFIPGHNIYIEFWGMLENEKYRDHKDKKLSLYKKYNLKLLELTEEDVKDIDDILPIKLLDFNIHIH